MRFVVSRQYASEPDQTYVAAKVMHWTYVNLHLTLPTHFSFLRELTQRTRRSVLEINIAIICACAVGFPAFFDAKTPRSFGSLVGSLLARRSASKLNVASEETTEKPYEGAAGSAENEMLGKSRWRILTRPSKASLRPRERPGVGEV
jgi:hypothetical protein